MTLFGKAVQLIVISYKYKCLILIVNENFLCGIVRLWHEI